MQTLNLAYLNKPIFNHRLKKLKTLMKLLKTFAFGGITVSSFQPLTVDEVLNGGIAFQSQKEESFDEACKQTVDWLKKWNTDVKKYLNEFVVADWDKNIDITPEHEAATDEKEAAFKAFVREQTEDAKTRFQGLVDACLENESAKECCITDEIDNSPLINPDLHKKPLLWTKKRQIRALNNILTYKVYHEQDMDSSSLDDEDLKIYQESMGKMINIYNTQKIVSYDGTEIFALEPEIYEVMDEKAQTAALSKDEAKKSWDEMKYYWYNWNTKVGQGCKASYEDFVEISNKAAQKNGFNDTGDSWRATYEDAEFEKTVDTLWADVKPLYEKLYGYVRHALNNVYGDEYVKSGKHALPAHVLGNMWAQDWAAMYPIVEPFPHAGVRPDATPELEKIEEIETLYQMSEEFFASLGYWNMTDIFWKESVIEKNNDVEMVCHASAWDFMAGDGMGDDGQTSDYRIKEQFNIKHNSFIN